MSHERQTLGRLIQAIRDRGISVLVIEHHIALVVHVCDESGAELPRGAEREMYFENGQQFAYHNDPEKTAS